MFKYSYFNSKLNSLGDHLQSALLLVIRLFWGGSFFVTGTGKLMNLGKVTDFFRSLGIPFPGFNAALTGTFETVFGACLFLGIFSRLASIPLICTMLVALATSDNDAVRMIFSDPQTLIHRDPFSFLFAAIIVFVFGPGAISLDYLFWNRKNKD